MAGPFYVSSVDGDTGDAGTSWALAKATIAQAIALITADGEIIYVDSLHDYVSASASIDWIFPAFSFSIISVNRAGGSLTWEAGAKETVDFNTGAFNIYGASAGSSVYIYGVEMIGDDGASGSNDISIGFVSDKKLNLTMDTCILTMRGTSGSAVLQIGAQLGASTVRAQRFTFNNCTINAKGATYSAMYIGGNSIYEFNDLTLGVAPLYLFEPSIPFISCTVKNSDLSGISTASSALVRLTTHTGGDFIFKDCKLHTNTTAVLGTWPHGVGTVTLINTASTDVINSFEHHSRLGSVTEDDTGIYADSGAQFNGTGVCWKVETTSVCNEANPFIVPDISRWNTAVALTNFDVNVNSSVALTDADCWMEIGIAENASFPNYTYYSSRDTTPFVSAGTSLSAGSTWTGVANNDLRMRITKTPVEVGLVTAQVYIGRATTTVYIDPIIRLS